AEDIVLSLIQNIRERLPNSSFPVLQPPIGVGSAFEGWHPHAMDSIYCFLVPLKPPYGHEFHLEPSTTGEMPARNFRICVDLVCTCLTEQWVEEMRCSIHPSEEESREEETHSHIQTLCSGSYLDVEKTARWLNQNVEAVWRAVPQLFLYRLRVLRSSRSCRFQVIKDSEKTLQIEMIFGVQEGDSDIFVSSQATEAPFTPSTTWTESSAVAEVKFFRQMARQVPPSSFHLRSLQVCTGLLVGQRLSVYAFKTVVMHLLTTTRFSSQHHPLKQQLMIVQYLEGCLKEKRLNHFFFGNENVPQEIVLPPHFRTAEPLNLFQLLAQNWYVYAEARCEVVRL
ncbi:IPIL1 protein, partial [Geococcyx californianus]|nr:IPIL1 protein [Geococcyx californianus]